MALDRVARRRRNRRVRPATPQRPAAMIIASERLGAPAEQGRARRRQGGGVGGGGSYRGSDPGPGYPTGLGKTDQSDPLIKQGTFP